MRINYYATLVCRGSSSEKMQLDLHEATPLSRLGSKGGRDDDATLLLPLLLLLCLLQYLLSLLLAAR